MPILKDGVLLTGANASIGKGTGAGAGESGVQRSVPVSL